MYFDQRMGALHVVGWLKTSFSASFHVFFSDMEKEEKAHYCTFFQKNVMSSSQPRT